MIIYHKIYSISILIQTFYKCISSLLCVFITFVYYFYSRTAFILHVSILIPFSITTSDSAVNVILYHKRSASVCCAALSSASNKTVANRWMCAKLFRWAQFIHARGNMRYHLQISDL